MPASRSPSPDSETDILGISTTLIPERTAKAAGTTHITFGGLLPSTNPLVLHEDLQEGCGGQLWPAGMVLSKYMLQYHKSDLAGKKVVEIGAGGGLVGLAVAVGCDLAEGQKLYITDQIPMLALMQRNIALNHLERNVEALVYNWGSPAPIEPAFPLLLHTLAELIGPDTRCYFCFKKRRKADMRFIRDMMKKFTVDIINYDDRDVDQRQAISLYRVTLKASNENKS